MRVVVCVTQILDPEIPPSEFRLDSGRKTAAEGIGQLVISIFDENALEVALQLRERMADREPVEIIALTVGPPSTADVLRKALSLRADRAILISSEDGPSLDGFVVARLLAAAVEKLLPVDLVLCGRETGDWHGGLVGSFLAEALGWTCVNFVSRVEVAEDGFLMRRQTDEGWEIVRAMRPAVATITNDEANVPRLPKVRDTMMAARASIPVWTVSELVGGTVELWGASERLQLRELVIPSTSKACEWIEGETVGEKAAHLVRALRERRIL
ncbi:MAG: electron transfer flavoprotein subunit beta/FixA family protein [Blastocatellia bacterium]|nr:electron transfer flavoprotein subunit beta/FixA family protein [Blastocatellia bacterium]MCS7156106.1 electron transfer flavoprotein subunit beta/FixA family protein [Blastocatellia bacterium]MDW8169257.1 electron transfer flavoprotein subunit beta/FixA family protein [Acidobacteriota bacterium]MDW8256116.1 electron transfer flavoprotein subunit beta/FixA family protein [Acidobacteriota bacterium]